MTTITMSLPTSGTLPQKALEDIRLHTEDFFEGSWWAMELLKKIEDPTYEFPRSTDQGDMTMMMMVLSQMQGFREQWNQTELSDKEVIYGVGQLIANNKAVREQAERAMGQMIEGARRANETGEAVKLD